MSQKTALYTLEEKKSEQPEVEAHIASDSLGINPFVGEKGSFLPKSE
jgi:hypothetical protein